VSLFDEDKLIVEKFTINKNQLNNFYSFLGITKA